MIGSVGRSAKILIYKYLRDNLSLRRYDWLICETKFTNGYQRNFLRVRISTVGAQHLNKCRKLVQR